MTKVWILLGACTYMDQLFSLLSWCRAQVALLEATRRVATEMEVLSSPIVLEFGGVSSFSTRVVFAAIKENAAKERLMSIAGLCQK